MTHTRHHHRPRRRRGVLSLELLITLPILGIVLLGLFEFSLLFYARAEVVEACRAGCRHATLHGCTAGDVEQQVRTALSPRLHDGLQVSADLGGQTGDVVTVAVSVPMQQAAPDLLWPVGFGLDGRRLYYEARMQKE
jgi:Flp pilus assembly protein TadG